MINPHTKFGMHAYFQWLISTYHRQRKAKLVSVVTAVLMFYILQKLHTQEVHTATMLISMIGHYNRNAGLFYIYNFDLKYFFDMVSI
jgi:hypothetical protein